MNAIDFYIFWSFFGAVIPPRFQAMWTLFLLHLVSFLWYQPAPCLQQLYPSFFSPALSHPLHYSSPPPPAPVPSVYPLRHYPPPLPSPPSSNLPMRYSRDQLLEIQPSTPNFELVNRLRELRLGVGLPRKRGCRGGRKKLRSIQVVPSRNLHPLMVPPFLQPHPDLQSAVGNAPLSSKHPTHLPTTDCLLSITPLMGGQPSDAPALSPPSPLQQGGQSSNAPALSPPSPLPQGSQPIALALSPSSPLPQDGQPSDAPGLSPSSSTLLLCPSDSTLSICHLNSQSAVKTAQCPADRDYVIDRMTSTCYRLVTSPALDWPAARAACDSSSEMLAVLEPMEKARFLQDFLRTNIALHNFSRSIQIGALRPEADWTENVPPSSRPRLVWVNGQPLDHKATGPFWRKDVDWSLRGNVITMQRNHRYLWGTALENLDRFYM
ncbi:hypothetical protein ACOMHN_040116 [Nucella lapillus]